MEELVSTHLSGRGQYYYYLAIGNARIREYTRALKFIKSAIILEPNNKQNKKVESLIKQKMDKENLINMTLTGSIMLVLGITVAVVTKILRK